MILVDTGPFVALFDPRDPDHDGAEDLLASLREPLVTTTPVLTEAFHLLDPKSRGAAALREFIGAKGVGVCFMDQSSLSAGRSPLPRISTRRSTKPSRPWKRFFTKATFASYAP